MNVILDMLQAGGALAQIAVFLLLWRIDRRLVVVETRLEVRQMGAK